MHDAINGVSDQTWDTASYAMEAWILRPLEWFGLLEHMEDETESSRFRRRHLYRKTALFDRFLSFEVRLEDTRVPRTEWQSPSDLRGHYPAAAGRLQCAHGGRSKGKPTPPGGNSPEFVRSC